MFSPHERSDTIKLWRPKLRSKSSSSNCDNLAVDAVVDDGTGGGAGAAGKLLGA